MKAFVTGGTGFIGANLASRLGNKVVAMTGTQTETPRGLSGYMGKILVPGLFGIDWGAVPAFDVLFHLAANNNTLELSHGIMTYDNAIWSERLLTEAKARGCKRVVYASSTAVYGSGRGSDDIMDEKDTIYPENLPPYGRSKHEAEGRLKRAASQLGMELVIVRLCNIYGLGEKHKGRRASMVYQIMDRFWTQQQIMLFKHGEQRRSWLYACDLVDLLEKAATTELFGAKPVTVNAAPGETHSFNDILKIMAITTDLATPSIKWIDPPKDYQHYVNATNARARELFNWTPNYSLTQAAREMLVYKKKWS